MKKRLFPADKTYSQRNLLAACIPLTRILGLSRKRPDSDAVIGYRSKVPNPINAAFEHFQHAAVVGFGVLARQSK
jgi:hypothetical protein